ncbi:hypothetical protein QQF64_034412 [Cirrhinus molitorella]|uniref:Uncharacterized protein n=1 Tax=Cirrhinus molitorella TaxID=172907 RepID=A0ABR3L4T5_9TELE
MCMFEWKPAEYPNPIDLVANENVSRLEYSNHRELEYLQLFHFQSDMVHLFPEREHEWDQQLAKRANSQKTPSEQQPTTELTTQVLDLMFHAKNPQI